MFNEVERHHHAELASLEAGEIVGALHIGFGFRGIEFGLLDTVLHQIDADALVVVLKQADQMSKSAAQFEQSPAASGSIPPHQSGIVTPSKPVHTVLAKWAICIVIPLEILFAIFFYWYFRSFRRHLSFFRFSI